MIRPMPLASGCGFRVTRVPSHLGGRNEVPAARTDHAGPLALEGDLPRGIHANQADGRIERLTHRLRDVPVGRN